MSLAVEHVSVVAARVDNAGPVQWLYEGLWIQGQYGATGGNEKSQKTFTMLDGAVSTASGTPFLDHFPVGVVGPVMVYLGEGGDRAAIRRLRAICESRGLILEDLPIYVRARAPHLGSDEHMGQLVEDVSAISPALVNLDPYYLSASGSDMKDLVSQGEMLEAPQHVCERVGSALQVVHHFNQGEGLETRRFSGTGLAQWARVLGMFEVRREVTDPVTRQSDATIAARFVGGEIPTTGFTLRRKIVADDWRDPNSPLHYEVVGIYEAEAPGAAGLSARSKVLAALTDGGGTVSEMGNWIADNTSGPLKYETIKKHLAELADAGMADSHGLGFDTEWFLADTEDDTAA